jgi:hypothetical protein
MSILALKRKLSDTTSQEERRVQRRCLSPPPSESIETQLKRMEANFGSILTQMMEKVDCISKRLTNVETYLQQELKRRGRCSYIS